MSKKAPYLFEASYLLEGGGVVSARFMTKAECDAFVCGAQSSHIEFLTPIRGEDFLAAFAGKMVGLFVQLSPEQKDAVLGYRGPDC